MADKLYRSYSLEKSQQSISGSMTVWEDSPVSPFDVGDTFHPVQGSPALTVEKVSIKDNVIGELNGRPVRQWEITIEGSNETQGSSQVTHVKYNFNISADEKSGTMEVVNTGNSPAITLEIGDTFSVPGIGQVYCSNVKGNDDYDDNGVHTWTVVYEGKNTQSSSSSLPETKYSLAIQKDDDGDIQKSGTMSVVNEGSTPTLNIQVGSTFSVPGLGDVTCTKVSGNDDYTETGAHRWTMTYEGVINSDDSGGGSETPDDNKAKYSFTLEQDSSSGSVEITNTGNSPSVAHTVGSTMTLPGVGTVTCTKVSGSDSYSDSGKRKWTITYEGTNKNNDSGGQGETTATTKYSLNIEKNSDGATVYSGSKEITCQGSVPTISTDIGDDFSLPVVGTLKCTRVHSSNDGDTWSVVIEGSRVGNDGSGSGSSGGEDTSLPETETVITYEINGQTVRSVAGELIALKRSATPISKKSITVYTNSEAAVAGAGDTYQGGIVLSENISKETIKNNGVVTGSYYKHIIEVES